MEVDMADRSAGEIGVAEADHERAAWNPELSYRPVGEAVNSSQIFHFQFFQPFSMSLSDD